MAALTKEKSTACNTKNVEYDINKVPLIISAIMNLSVTIMSLIGLVIHFQKSGLKMLILYTIDSNILGGIACFIAAVFTLRQIINNKPLPKRVSMLKYISTCCLCVTFLWYCLFWHLRTALTVLQKCFFAMTCFFTICYVRWCQYYHYCCLIKYPLSP